MRATRWQPASDETTRKRELAAIRHPTLHVYGTADRLGSAELWRRVAGRLPHGPLSIVEHAGHMPWFDDSTRVGQEVGNFLAE